MRSGRRRHSTTERAATNRALGSSSLSMAASAAGWIGSCGWPITIALRHLVETVTVLQERGVGFRSIQEAIDTTTPGGRLVFHVFCALAEFERDIIRERTHAGLSAARARGRVGGRKPALTPHKAALARRLYDAKEHTVAQIATVLGVSRATIYRHLTTGVHQDRPRAEAVSDSGR